MAPISTSPAAPQATHRISSALPATLQGSKQLVIYVAALVILGFLFLLAGVYLLYVHRRLSRPGKAARTAADAEDGEGRIKVERSRVPISRKYSSTTTSDQDVTTQMEKHDEKAKCEFQTLKPPARSTADPRPSSLSEDEVERMRLLAFKFPPVQESGQDNMHVASDASVFRVEAKGTSDTSIAVQSAEAVRPSAFGTRPVEVKRPRCHDTDRGESTLKRLDAIIAQEPTFVVPEETLPLFATDSMRHVRVMNLLDDILAQEPPPLSPDSNASDVPSPSLDSPNLATSLLVTNGRALQPLGLAQLRHLADGPRVVVLVEASPRLTQRYLVHPILNTWSKLTGREDIPLVSHPAITLEDPEIGELPMQSLDDLSLFDFGTSPEIEYLTPSWNVPIVDEDDKKEEEEEPVCEPPRIVMPVCMRWLSPLVKPRCSQLREMSRQPTFGQSIGPGNALGLSLLPESAFYTEDMDAELAIPSRAIIPSRPAHKMAVQYGYF